MSDGASPDNPGEHLEYVPAHGEPDLVAQQLGDNPDSQVIRSRVADAFDKVPAIGDARRWYDYPYRLLIWLSTGPRRKLPRGVREWFNYGVNYLIAFNEHDRHKVWDPSDPLHNFVVPAEEHVTIPTVWVVELFPPSELASLAAAIDRHAWDRRRRFIGGRETNQELLARSRDGTGAVWWRLADIIAPKARRWSPDGNREKLPDQFDAVSLKAMHMGPGLTAVVAQFWLTKRASQSVDEVWHVPHEPKLVRNRGTRPRAEDRAFAAYRTTQESRVRLHQGAREWISRHCPGFFAVAYEEHTLADLVIMDQFDPLAEQEVPRGVSDAHRALGLTEHGYLWRTSTAMPKLALVPTRLGIASGMRTHRTWAIWGQRAAALEAAKHIDFYGGQTDDALGHLYSDGLQGFLLTAAVSDFLEVVEQQFARLRDSARSRHGEFSGNSLEDLRQHLLTLSLDLASVRRDLDLYRRRKAVLWDEAQFTVDVSPSERARLAAAGRKPPNPVCINDAMRERHAEDFDRLTKADKDYREILSTVASLGASAHASKLGRRALWVAAASLVVALVTVLVADLESASLLSDLLDRLTN